MGGGMAGFDIEGAKKAGYSDEEIASYLGPERGFNVGAARQAGYTGPEILEFLTKGENRTWGEFGKDMAVKAGQGVIGLGQSVVGLGSIVSGGLVGKAMQGIGYEPKQATEMLGAMSSEKQKRMEQDIQRSGDGKGFIDGFVDTIGTVAQNPSSIPGFVVESLPSMLAADGGARALAERIYSRAATAAAAAGPEAAAAAGRAAVEAATGSLKWAAASGEGALTGGQIADQAREAGRTWEQYVLPALAGGAGTAVIGRAAGSIPGLGDAETAAFTGATKAAATGNRLVRAGKGALQEGVLEELPQSVQEQAWSNIAQGKPFDEGLGPAAAQGLIAGSALGMGMGSISKAAPPEQRAAEQHEAETAKIVTDIGSAETVDQAIAAAATETPLFFDKFAAQEELNRAAAAPETIGGQGSQDAIPFDYWNADRPALPAPDMETGRPIMVNDGDPDLTRPERFGDRETAINAVQAQRERVQTDLEMGKQTPRGPITLDENGKIVEAPQELRSLLLATPTINRPAIAEAAAADPAKVSAIATDATLTRAEKTKLIGEIVEAVKQEKAATAVVPSKPAESAGTPKGLEVEFDGKRYPVASIQEASEKWTQFRQQSDAGVSDVGNGVPVFENGKQVARISYNGRMWDMADNEIGANQAKGGENSGLSSLPATEKARLPSANSIQNSEQAPSTGHFSAGEQAFKEGKPRTLPTYFTKASGKNAKEWYRGWDAANVAAITPVTGKQPETVGGQGSPVDGESKQTSVILNEQPKAEHEVNGVYRDGSKWKKIYRPVRRNDGAFMLTRELSDDDGVRIEYFGQDGEWHKGRPSKTVVSGVSQVGGAETFTSESAALDIAKDDAGPSATGQEPAATTAELDGDGQQDELPPEMRAYEAKAEAEEKARAEAAKKPAKSAEQMRAEADLMAGLADLADIFGKNTKLNMMEPEQEQKLLPILTKVFDAAFRLGHIKFKQAAKFVLDTIRAKLGADIADALTLEHLQGAYIGMSGRYKAQGAEGIAAVSGVTDKADIEKSAGEAQNDGTAKEAARDEQDDQPAVGTRDTRTGSSPGRKRGARPQQSSPQLDFGNLGAGESENVGTPESGQTRGTAGESAAGPDVGPAAGSAGIGNAGNGRPGAGRSGNSDAGTRGGGRRPAAGPRSDAPDNRVTPESPAAPPPGDFVIADPLKIVGGGQVARFEKNKTAIELRNRLVEEGRKPTPEEQATLAGYTGWGSFGQDLFQGTWEKPAPKAGWEKRDQWLRDNLGQNEWEGMQRSIINAHYTDPPTVMAMWDMVKRAGFKGGRVLEPSIGIGNFFGMMPVELSGRSQRAGIELDPMTGSMAQMLYPSANIQIKGYEASTTPDNFYDLVIGNWPFSEISPADRRYNRLSPTLHDYFFLKAIDQTKPGGLIVGITTKGTMDKKGVGARMEMARKAELIAAFRLPSGAFEEYAGTAVVTDIIILRKRDEPKGMVDKEGWIDVNDHPTKEGTQVPVNEYFHKNPSHVIGEIDFGHGTTTFRPGLIVRRPADMMEQLRRIVDLVPENVFTAAAPAKHISYVANHTSDRTNSLVKNDNGLYIVNGEYMAPANEIAKYELKDPAKTAAREKELTALIDMRKLYGRLIDAERAGNAETERKELREAYEAFKKAHGTLSTSFGLGYLRKIDDPFYPALASLEIRDASDKYRPAGILTASTMRGAKQIDKPTVSDAFVLARNSAVNPTVEQIAEIAKVTPAEAKQQLIAAGAAYELPNGDFAPSDIYLSGNVRAKMREARAALEAGNKEMERNIAALEKVIPADVPYYKIETQMGATWVMSNAYAEYIAHMLGMDSTAGIDVNFQGGMWKIQFDSSLNSRPQAQSGFGSPHVKFKRLVRAAIANQTINVKRKDVNGTEYVDDEATKEVNTKISEMRLKFGEWLWSDPTRRIALETEYNEVRNSYATPSFDGSFLGFQGMALSFGDGPFNLRQHQVNAIWRALVTRKSLNAHEVGTGKTFTMGGIAVESRRYGIAKKPMLFAHNANSKSVAHEIQMMYPGAKVLYIDNLSKENVKTRMRQIANDDWDLVVLPHSLIDRIGFKEETLMAMAKEEIADLEIAAEEAAQEDSQTITTAMWDDEEELKKLRSPTAKQLVKARMKIIETINKLSHRASQEDSIPFEDMGVDMLLVDEAHEFKKPPIATKMRMKGLQTQTSNRSIAMMFLTRYVRNMNNGANVHLFTGTPITNTMTEVFHMMRYMMLEEMQESALADWDGWFGSFAREVNDVELNPAGEYEAVTRLQSFINVPELRRMIGQYMDVVFAEDMPEMKLRLVDGKRLTDKDLTEKQRAEILNGRTERAKDRPYKKVVNENSDMTPEQNAVFQQVQGWARSWRSMTKKDRKEAMLSGAPESPIIHEGIAAKASFDVRLVRAIENAGKEGTDEMAPHPDSKPARVVKNLLEIYHSDQNANQVVFMEQGMATSVTRREGPMGAKRDVRYPAFSTVQDMIKRLVAAGIPREQIALVDGSTSKDKRKEVADAMNSGKIRIVFGSTDSLGVGVNMQRNLRAMHHMDAPWMPGELEQRNGRGHRQGNQWNTVMEYRYLTDRLDGRRWQVLAIKQRFITDFMKSKGEARVIEGDAASDEGGDILSTFSEAAGDPRVLLREKYKGKLEQLHSRERMHTQAMVDAQRTVAAALNSVNYYQERLDKLRTGGTIAKLQKVIDTTAADAFAMEIGKSRYTVRAEAHDALEKWLEKNVRMGDEKEVGEFGGEPVYAKWSNLQSKPSLYMRFGNDVEVWANPTVASLESNLRHERKTVEADPEKRISEAKARAAHAEKVAKEPFHMGDELKAAEKRLDDLVADLEKNPVAAPYWLRAGAPADTEVFRNGNAYIVTGHRWADDGWFVLAKDDKGETAIPYLQATDSQNMPLYEERTFEAPTVQTKDDKKPGDAPMASRGNDAFGLRQFGVSSLDDLPEAYRNTADWLEVPAKMRDMDAARALRQSLADLEESINDRKEGSEAVVLSLDDSGNINIARLNLTGEAQISAVKQVIEFADANDLGVLIRASAYSSGPADNMPARLGFSRYGASVKQAATKFRNPMEGRGNPVTWMRNVRGAPLFYRASGDLTAPAVLTAKQARAELVKAFGERGIANLERDGILWIGNYADAPRTLTGKLQGNEEGAYWNGRGYIFVDNLSAGQAPSVLLHEIGEHYGLEEMLGADGYRRAINQVKALHNAGNPAIVAAWNHVKRHYNEPEGSNRFIHEVIAKAGQDGDVQNMPWWKRLMAAVRAFLVSKGFKNIGSEADLEALLYASLRKAMRDAGDAVPIGGEAMASRLSDQLKGLNKGAADGLFKGEPELDGDRAVAWLRRTNPKKLVSLNARAVTTGKDVGDLAAQEVRNTAPEVLDWPMASRGNSSVADVWDTLQASKTPAQARQSFMDLLDNPNQFSWWDKSIGTQLNKARKNRHFARVFDAMQRQQDDTAAFAIEAEAEAADVLARMNDRKEILSSLKSTLSGERSKDLAAVSKAIFANIEGKEGVQQKVFTDAELAKDYGLNDRQIGMYRQSRDAIDRSLDRYAQSLTLRTAQKFVKTDDLRRNDLAETVETLTERMRLRIETLKTMTGTAEPGEILRSLTITPDGQTRQDYVKVEKEDAGQALETEIAALETAVGKIGEIAEHANGLKDAGYSPAMRFGDYAVSGYSQTYDGSPRIEFFSMADTRVAANAMRMRLQREHPDWQISVAPVDKESFKLFRGISPDTVELFAKFMDVEQDAAFKEYIALATSSRSAMKRMLERGGVAGFSENLPRVLSAFITSNSRAAAQAVNGFDINDAFESIPQHQGDVRAEAAKLIDYMRNPTDDGAKIRGFMFAYFMGGSVSSALVNLTQPVMMTAPYLQQFAGSKIAGIMAKTAKMAATGNIPVGDLKAAFDRAEAEGVTDAHEYHQLMQEAEGGGSVPTRAVMKAWGSLFGAAEKFNRRITFLAAFETAKGMTQTAIRQSGATDAYDFAKRAVAETQGVYAKHNRPNWARGTVGALLFTFKQFSIAYIEFFNRLPMKQKLLAVAMLILAAGIEGLPFADDLEDLIDTIGQKMGFGTNSKKTLHKAAVATLGEAGAQFALYGVSGLSGIPMDVAGRLGMGNLLPGTKLLNPSVKDKGREVLEVAGAAGGLAKKALDAADQGKAAEAMPKAFSDAAKAIEMFRTGEYRDTRGRKVQDVNTVDGLMKLIGFQPQGVAAETRGITRQMRDVDIVKRVEADIADQWAEGIRNKSVEETNAARTRLRQWNEDNPDMPIKISMTQVIRRVKQANLTRDQRFAKTAPPEMRRRILQEAQQ